MGDERADEVKALLARGYEAFDISDWNDARSAFEQAITLLEGTRNDVLSARAWEGLSIAARRAGDPARAVLAAERALECARRSNQRFWIVRTLRAFARRCRDACRFDEALRACEEARSLIDAERAPLELAAFRFIEADVLLDTDRPIEARELFEAASVAFEHGGGLDQAIECKHKLAEISATLGDRAKARALFAEVLAHWEAREQPWGQANALDGLADIAKTRGDLREANALYGRARAQHRRAGNSLGEAGALRALGALAMDRGDYVRSMEDLRAALAIDRRRADRFSAASTLVSMGDCSLRDDRPIDAFEYASEARVEAISIGARAIAGNAAFLLASVMLEREQLDDARWYCDEARIAFEGAGRKHGLANVASKLGDIALDVEESDVARRHYERALELFEELGHEFSIGSTLERLSFVARTDGERTELLQRARAAFVRANRQDLVRVIDRALRE